MKTRNKILTGIALVTGTVAAAAAVNKLIFSNAVKEHLLKIPSEKSFYQWRFGSVYYEKSGQGNPVLLIHDLNPAASSYEWHKCTEELSKNYCVYTLDLLGCGRSEKPNLLYTNFLYTQLINDFIKDVIGHRTNIIASNASCPLALVACLNAPDSFDKICLINPPSLQECGQIPTDASKLYMHLLDIPVFGTMIYNIAFSKKMLRETFEKEYIFDSDRISDLDLSCYHESAHLSGSPSKALFASIHGKYTNFNVSKALKDINHNIFIIGSEEIPSTKDTILEYQNLNPVVESLLIPNSKKMIALERPENLTECLKRII